MAKLIPLEEAAGRLGISPEELTDMRSRNEVFGYRDGASWKFKPEELDRVAAMLGSGSTAEDSEEVADLTPVADDDELIDVGTLNLDDEGGDDSDSILVTEEELGRSDESTSSTIIGKTGEVSSSESDIKLADSLDEPSPLDGGSDLDLALDGDSDLSLADSDLSLDSEGAAAGASDVLAGDSDLLSLDDGGTGSAPAGSGIDLSLDDGSDAGGSSLKLSGSDISLDDELSLEGDSGGSGAEGLDSSLDLDLEDDELALGSGTGSDITLGASDSGINLSNPSDSGISLEDGSGLGSGIDSSLELGDEIELEIDGADEDDATELQEDEEFLLTPVAGDGELDEESDDSGSQVIALDEEEFDESEATMLVEDTPLIAEDEEDFGGIDDLGVTPAKVAATAGGAAVTTAEEGDFSVWNIVGLSMLSMFMGLCGILALDVIRNIWSWDEPYSLNSTIMDFIVGML